MKPEKVKCSLMHIYGLFQLMIGINQTIRKMGTLKSILFISILSISGVAIGQNQSTNVVVNGVELNQQTIQSLQNYYRVQIKPGRYWYDKMCGAWGYEGGPGVSVMMPGLDIGGTLRENASNGKTNIIINGRRLHVQDVTYLQNIVGQAIAPGRYWLNAQGYVGFEGGPALVNLYYLSQQQQNSGNGYTTRNSFTGIGSGSDGNTSYIMGDGWSVMTGN